MCSMSSEGRWEELRRNVVRGVLISASLLTIRYAASKMTTADFGQGNDLRNLLGLVSSIFR